MSNYQQSFELITHEIDTLMIKFSHTKTDIGYGYRRRFDNNKRFDLIDYKKHNHVFLRVGQGARLVNKHPILYSLFDEVAKVIAKFQVHNIETLHEKHIVGVFELLDAG